MLLAASLVAALLAAYRPALLAAGGLALSEPGRGLVLVLARAVGVIAAAILAVGFWRRGEERHAVVMAGLLCAAAAIGQGRIVTILLVGLATLQVVAAFLWKPDGSRGRG